MQEIDFRAVPRSRVRPDTLIALLRTYELNYILLKHLFADGNIGAAYAVDYPDLRHRLESVLLRRERYTTTLRLTYSLLGRACRPLVHPAQLTVRVYHDARQAELLCLKRDPCCAAARSREASLKAFPWDAPGEEGMAERCTCNRFLGNVLTLFHRRGIQLTQGEQRDYQE